MRDDYGGDPSRKGGMDGMAAALTVLVRAKGVDRVNEELEETTMKPGPKKGDPRSRAAGREGGKSRPRPKGR